MPKDQIAIGILVAALCVMGMWNDRWLLQQTRKGQRLVNWLGETKAIWTLRILFLLGAVFGILLACDFIRPVNW